MYDMDKFINLLDGTNLPKIPGKISAVKKHRPTGWTTQIFISGVLDEQFKTAEYFQRDLAWNLTNDQSQEIELIINSRGGNLLEACAIYDALMEIKPKKITAKIYGICGSAATVIACAADEIYMGPSATWFIHEVRSEVEGTSDDMIKCAEDINNFTGKLLNIYAEKTGKTTEELAAFLKEEKSWTAEEAVEYGWSNGVLNSGEEQEEIETPINNPLENLSNILSDDTKKKKNILQNIAHLFGLTGSEIPKESMGKEENESELQSENTRLKAELTGLKKMFNIREAQISEAESNLQNIIANAVQGEIAALGHQGEIPSPAGTLDENNSEEQMKAYYTESDPQKKANLYKSLFGNSFKNLPKH